MAAVLKTVLAVAVLAGIRGETLVPGCVRCAEVDLGLVRMPVPYRILVAGSFALLVGSSGHNPAKADCDADELGIVRIGLVRIALV